MKHALVALAALLSTVLLADTATTNKTSTGRRKLDRAKAMARWYARTGGQVMVPNSKKGKIVFVNAQSKADVKWIEEVAKTFIDSHKFDIAIEKGEFALPNPKIVGTVSLYVVDDANLPVILHAPENRWTMVNIATLQQGDGVKPQFFEARVKKELTRGFCLLAGTQTSNYPNSLLTSVTKPEDLDTHPDSRIQFDIQQRFEPYLAGLGVTAPKYEIYRKACQEGWAPNPTNDVQKKIWDEVHEIPAKPIQIKFDPKTDTK